MYLLGVCVLSMCGECVCVKCVGILNVLVLSESIIKCAYVLNVCVVCPSVEYACMCVGACKCACGRDVCGKDTRGLNTPALSHTCCFQRNPKGCFQSLISCVWFATCTDERAETSHLEEISLSRLEKQRRPGLVSELPDMKKRNTKKLG